MPHATTYIVAVHIAGCGCTKKFLQCTYMYDMHNVDIARGVLGNSFGPQQNVEADPEKRIDFKMAKMTKWQNGENDKNEKMTKITTYVVYSKNCSLHQHL